MFGSAGAFLLTQKDVFFAHEQACFLASAIITRDDPNIKVNLPPPAIVKVCIVFASVFCKFISKFKNFIA